MSVSFKKLGQQDLQQLQMMNQQNTRTVEDENYVDESLDNQVSNLMMNTIYGVEGIPYQFMETVDRRIDGKEIGRKYGEKIIARIPLLFLTPCTPQFMSDFKKNDKTTLIESLLTNAQNLTETNLESLLKGKGRYYSMEHSYAEYFEYLNTMLSAVAYFLGIADEKIIINGEERKIGNMSWENELNDNFKTYFSASENIIFYLDGLHQVSESYSNDTTESSLASQINGFADTANEIKFLLGSKGSVASNFMDSTSDVTSTITQALSKGLTNLGGGIIGSLADKGVNTVLNGGKIVFPKIWSNSSTSRSYSVDIKLRSPDHDSLSIFLNVLKPYCKILSMMLPRVMQEKDGKFTNNNGYISPFMVKAYSKGIFNVDYGIISSMSVTKGDECCWNDDGLPTQIDISIDIEDLYSSLAMTPAWKGTGNNGLINKLTDPFNLIKNNNAVNFVCNTSYMDFLANMAGLNIGQQEIGRRITTYVYMTKTNIAKTKSRFFTTWDQTVSRLMNKLYNFSS